MQSGSLQHSNTSVRTTQVDCYDCRGILRIITCLDVLRIFFVSFRPILSTCAKLNPPRRITIPDNISITTSAVGNTGMTTSSVESTRTISTSIVTVTITGAAGNSTVTTILPPVTIPVTVGIATGCVAFGVIIVAIGFLLFPIILRKVIKHGAVTGVVGSGLYRVINEEYLNAAVPSNHSFDSPISGISYGRLPEHKVSTYVSRGTLLTS